MAVARVAPVAIEFAPPGASAGNGSREEELMVRDQLSRRSRRLLERLSQPSSAAGLAALLALLVPQLAEHAPALVGRALSALAVGAALWAIVRREGNRVERPRRLTAPAGIALEL